MVIQHAVFVNSITSTNYGSHIVQASNGSPNGPPAVTFEADALLLKRLTIGARFKVTIEEFPDIFPDTFPDT